MSETREELTAAAQAVSPQPVTSSDSDVAFRHDLAFPRLSERNASKTQVLRARRDRPERHLSVHVW